MTKYEELQSLIEQMITTAGSGHYASSMSALEIMYPLFYEQGVKPEQFILSKGHAAPALYAILADLGELMEETLSFFRVIGGLPGHPSLETPGVTASSGSLGMGISKAIGLAHANPDKTYHVLVGDGELQEGQNWEALLYAGSNKVTNVIIHVDCNNMQYSSKLRNMNECVAFREVTLGGVNVIKHNTRWLHDNHYLTRPDPSMNDYRSKIRYYSICLEQVMAKDSRIVVLNADLEHDFGLTIIKDSFVDRYIQCGISEQHMVSMANGLALAGKIPITHGFGAFYRRATDQIWNNLCDEICIGYVAGLSNHGNMNIGKSHISTGKPDFLPWQAADIDSFFRGLEDTRGGLWLAV